MHLKVFNNKLNNIWKKEGNKVLNKYKNQNNNNNENKEEKYAIMG